MAKSWKNKYSRKHGISYTQKREEEIKEERRNYTNLKVSSLADNTFYNPRYLGLITDTDNEACEVHRVTRTCDDQEIYAIVRFTKPIQELPSTHLDFKVGDIPDSITIYHGEYMLRSTIEITREDDINFLVMETLRDKSKTLDERIELIIQEMNDVNKKILI